MPLEKNKMTNPITIKSLAIPTSLLSFISPSPFFVLHNTLANVGGLQDQLLYMVPRPAVCTWY